MSLFRSPPGLVSTYQPLCTRLLVLYLGLFFAPGNHSRTTSRIASDLDEFLSRSGFTHGRAAVKTKRQDSLSSTSHWKLKLSHDSDESSSGFDLTPSQSPGPTLPLSEICTDPRIPNDGQPVEIGNTLLLV